MSFSLLLFPVLILGFSGDILANPGSEPFLGGIKQGTNGTLDNLEEYLAQKH